MAAATALSPSTSATGAPALPNPFEEELKSFKSRLKPREKEYFKFATEHEFAKEIDVLQTKLHQGRRQQNMTKLKEFIEAMNQFGKVIDVFCQTSEILAFVWGPWKLLLLIGDTFSTAFSELLDTYQKLGKTLRLLPRTLQLFPGDKNMAEVLAEIYRDILNFHFEAFKYFQQPMLKQIFHATWKTYKTKFSDLIHNMDQHVLFLLEETTLAEARRSRELEMARSLQARSEMECSIRERIIGWLQRPGTNANVKNDHAKLLRIRSDTPGSGRWLLSKPEFERWFGEFPNIPALLWIKGIPGAGKTVLASLIIEQAQQALNHKPTVLYFYCKADNPDKDNFLAIGRSLILQLLEQNPGLLHYFYSKYQSSTEGTLTTISILEEMLETGIKNTASTYIILDGLDECPATETRAIAQWFRKLVEDQPRANPDQIRCLFVSQADKITRQAFRDLSSLKIQPKDNLEDISQFSSHWAVKIQKRFELRDEERRSIAQKVPDVCGGMFLLAKLICENLYEQANIDDLNAELEPDTFPHAIDEAYERIMARLSSQAPRKGKTDYCLLLLGWLVCAKRPLKWCEIQTIRSIDPDAQTINLRRYSFRDGPKDICGSLVEEDDSGTVELVHLTAKQFLTRKNYVNSTAEEIKFAILCLNYLNLSDFQLPLTNIEGLTLQGHYNFLEYSVLNWLRHIESASDCLHEHNTLRNDLAESLDCFLDLHYTDPAPISAVPENERRKWGVFEALPFFEKLLRAILSTQKHLSAFEEVNCNEASLDIFIILQEVRQHIELLAGQNPTAETAAVLERFFGRNVFKCSRPSCRFFEMGFSSSSTRNLHLEKHSRPFLCHVEGCLTSFTGLATARDLEAHLRTTHDIGEDEGFPTEEELRGLVYHESHELTFGLSDTPRAMPDFEDNQPEPKTANKTAPSRQQAAREIRKPMAKRQKSEHTCPTCAKKFTKRFNMESHARSHSIHRAFECDFTDGDTECRKTFVRRSDLTRHRKSHSDGKYICSALMPDGTERGCGRSFSRADTLKNHLNSHAGAQCRTPQPPTSESEI